MHIVFETTMLENLWDVRTAIGAERQRGGFHFLSVGGH